jgi:hypothetical protein
MEFILLLIIVVVVVYYINRSKGGAQDKTPDEIKPTVNYHYRRKDFVMTKAENDFFNSLTDILGDEYYVFPQVHLSTILDHKIKGQNWKAAFSYINQKSVDYVVCNRQYRRPILGIELDDWSHDGDVRKQRDINVDYMFKESGIPLLRLRDVRGMTATDIKAKLDEYLPKTVTETEAQPVASVPTGSS